MLASLRQQLWRAVRLVIDSGIHYKKWTREQAIGYMISVTGFTRELVITEVERYIVDPGQACAYQIGLLKILELKQKAQQQLKQKFDIRQFHNVLIANGAMPLKILEQQVEQYIARISGLSQMK